MQTGCALATYAALMAAFLAGFSPLEFALYSAVLLCLWVSLYSMASNAPRPGNPGRSSQTLVPTLSESMAELHSLQCEISALQTQFAAQTKTRLPPDDTAV